MGHGKQDEGMLRHWGGACPRDSGLWEAFLAMTSSGEEGLLSVSPPPSPPVPAPGCRISTASGVQSQLLPLRVWRCGFGPVTWPL